MAIDPARAKSLFLNASDLTDPAERAAYLDRECGEDDDLRRRVEALLSAHDAAPLPSDEIPETTGLHTPRLDGAPSPLPTTVLHQSDAKPDVLIAGRYTLQEKIGEGGMGEVWVAKQTEPVKRKVALKLIKTGMDSRAVLQRFELERQALAMMDHPNIARVFDAGLTPSGQPFFAMELVNGLPLNKFCDEARLTTNDRLELFVSICNAVQHAHQKGIVHRDLKPANILVTIIDGRPVPKVIDFGVAKATAGKLTDDSLSTQFGAIVGTLEYMSPEQAGFGGEDIDTRSDVYSLGVILYELLTGLRPIDARRLRKAALTEMIRLIREEDPSKPSTRLSTDDSLPSLAAVRQIEPRRLLALLRGELDWVVMKCLEKRRDRRYETANGLARDIQRFLSDEAVEARPPSAGYRLGKFLHRNRRPVLAASLVLLAVLGGLSAVLVVQARSNAALKRANGETRAALEKVTKAQKATADALAQSEESLKQAKAVGDFLVDAFQKPDPDIEGRDVKVADVIDQAMDGLARGFDGSKATEAALLDALGRSYLGLGLYDKAIEALGKERAIREAMPDFKPVGMYPRHPLLNAYYSAGRGAEAIALREAALRIMEPRLGPDHPDTLTCRNRLAYSYQDAGRVAEAIAMYQENLRLLESRPVPDDIMMASTRVGLAEAYRKAGRVAEAIALYEAVLRFKESRSGPESIHVGSIRGGLAALYRSAGRAGDAVALYEAALRLSESKLGPDDLGTILARRDLADAYRSAGRVGDAVALYEVALRHSESKLGPDHYVTRYVRDSLADAYKKAGRGADAVALYEVALGLSESKLGPDHYLTLDVRDSLADAYQAAGRIGDAIAIHEATLRITAANPDPRIFGILPNRRDKLALAYRAAGRAADAIAIDERTLGLRESRYGPDHRNTLGVRDRLADAYRKAGRTAQAVAMYEATLRIRLKEPKLGPDHPATLTNRIEIAEGYEALGSWAAAEPLRRDIVARLRKIEEPISSRLALALFTLGRNLVRQKKWSDAESTLRECLAIRIKAIPDDYRRYHVESLLGATLIAQAKYAEAEPLVIGGYEGMKARDAKIPANGKNLLTEASDRVVRLYRAWGKPEQAAAWSARLGLTKLPKNLFAK